MPSDPRIGGFHFPRRRLDGGQSPTIRPSCRPHRISSATDSAAADILTSMRDVVARIFAGILGRPQCAGSTELGGTEYGGGWVPLCYRAEARHQDNDFELRSWSCAEGLACQVVDKASRTGMCFVSEIAR